MTHCFVLMGLRAVGLCTGRQAQCPAFASPPPTCSSHILAAPNRKIVERRKMVCSVRQLSLEILLSGSGLESVFLKM